MKKLVYPLLAGILLASCHNHTTSEVAIDYNVLPHLKDSIPSVEVTFEYMSDTHGVITLRYENDSWGDQNNFNCIQDFEVLPQAESVEFIKDSSLVRISTSPNTMNTIRYRIVKDYDGPPLNEKRYRPMVDSTYFHVLGMRLFMIPERVFASDTSLANIRINYLGDTKNRLFHSSFGTKTLQEIKVTREDIYASFFVGGDFRRHAFPKKKDSVYFLTRGDWKSFTDQQIFKLLEETITTQNDFWKDPRNGDFSVSLVPTYEPWYSVGGSGFSNSFISFASNNDKVTLHHMRWLYNHELLHKWIGRTIINENEVQQYWFSEGFTDYYAYKLQLKSGHLDIAEYVAILNQEVLQPHYQDPVRNVPNAQLTFQEYWGNYAKYQKLPYRRGLLYAFLIDTQIKEASNYRQSLDNPMQELLTMALEDSAFRFNESVFIELLTNYLKDSDVKADFEKYIRQGEPIDFRNQLPNGLLVSVQDGIPIFSVDTDNLKDLERKLKI